MTVKMAKCTHVDQEPHLEGQVLLLSGWRQTLHTRIIYRPEFLSFGNIHNPPVPAQPPTSYYKILDQMTILLVDTSSRHQLYRAPNRRGDWVPNQSYSILQSY